MHSVARLGSGIELVARDRELGRLRAALEQSAAGTPAAVLISGDAGVGKTRLTEELAALAREKDALVLTGRCLDAGEAGLPYLPFAEAMAQIPDPEQAVLAHPALARLLPDVVLSAGEPAAGREVMPALRAGVGARTGARPEQDVGQLQVFDAVHGVLTDLAAQRCVVLVLEDLHWADGSTRWLLAFLVSRLRQQRVLVVGTYRGDDLHRRHPLRPLLAELVRLPATERLELAPFGAEDSRTFVAALADEVLAEDMLREVAERSEGNAFFAEELVAAYTEDGAGLPATLVDVLLARVERLAEPAQHVVRVASVAGRRCGHDVLLEVADLGEQELEEALREAVQHHVLVATQDQGLPVYVFRHALLREAVYSDLLPGERVRLHAAYASCLARGPQRRGTAAALAHHSMESHQLPQALAASIRAGKEAKHAGAPTEGLHHYERALKLWDAVAEADRPSGPDEANLLRQASYLARIAGEPERAVAFAKQAVKLVDQTGDPEEAALTRRRLASALFGLEGRDGEARRVIEEAWELIAGLPASCEKAWVLAVYATILRGSREPVEARTFAELAVRDARASGEPGVEADALITLGALDQSDGLVEQSRERLWEAQRLAHTDSSAVTVELRAWYYLGVNYYEHGDLDEAVRVIDQGFERAKQTGLTWGTYGFELRTLKVVSTYARGDWDVSEAVAEPPGRRVSNTVSARLAAVGSHVMVSRGRLAEVARLAEELRGDWNRDFQIGASMGAAGAQLAFWQGRFADGVRHVRDAVEWAERVGGKWALSNIRTGALGVALCAELAAQAARRQAEDERLAAVEEGERLLALARDTARFGRPSTGVLGPEGRAWVARAEAEHSRLHGGSDAELWRAAIAAFGYGAVYEQAVCRWRLGEVLLRADERSAAAEELGQAEEVAARLGARPLLEAVRRLARRARLAVGDGPAPREPLDPFTPRERSVLRLVALGRTNRQVGEELFISEKTVSVHLSRIMAKLGASRRTEAVALAYDRGLLDDPTPAP
ncbi:helix-turn-helix transcriptional regulator [Actinophytocola xanthii]|uniref:LuxR family transcriptional regulator n=1 Tax=Actinophytocola xanthii TaxID=1912961 RepID=A0A1Q8CP82_9PSEU|nr:helix-turn-helix transcriptional regulator [Actinophytocola xanthii]OLF16155.1 LuxR family transcriptional regulator [Actinophytocola xanthii]